MDSKICQRCKVEKTIGSFDAYITKSGEKRYKGTCTVCKHRAKSLKEKYGITLSDYDIMFIEQEGKCKICDSTTNAHSRNNYLDIDHCHITGKVRGLLCNKCNKAIGYFNDDPELLVKALKYLEPGIL